MINIVALFKEIAQLKAKGVSCDNRYLSVKTTLSDLILSTLSKNIHHGRKALYHILVVFFILIVFLLFFSYFQKRLWIDQRCHITLGIHRRIDGLSGGQIGTTAQGIGPTYSDKAGV